MLGRLHCPPGDSGLARRLRGLVELGADGLGHGLVATRRHAGKHALDDEASKEVLWREHRPGVELDLLALARAATRAAHGDLAAADDDRAGRRAVPAGVAGGDLRVPGADALGELCLHHLGHHDKAGSGREREQPVLHRPSDLGERHDRLEAEPGEARRGEARRASSA